MQEVSENMFRMIWGCFREDGRHFEHRTVYNGNVIAIRNILIAIIRNNYGLRRNK